jgi:hypothetical protein
MAPTMLCISSSGSRIILLTALRSFATLDLGVPSPRRPPPNIAQSLILRLLGRGGESGNPAFDRGEDLAVEFGKLVGEFGLAGLEVRHGFGELHESAHRNESEAETSLTSATCSDWSTVDEDCCA